MKGKISVICLLVFGASMASGWPRIHYAQFPLGESDTGLSYECVFMVSNKVLTEPWRGEITLGTGDDQDLGGGMGRQRRGLQWFHKIPVSLEPAGSAIFVISGGSTVRTGYLDIEGDRSFFYGDVATTLIYQLKQNGQLIDSVGSGITEGGFISPFRSSRTPAPEPGSPGWP